MEDGHHTPHSRNGEGKIGRVLEQARKDRGLSLEEAERATKIRKRYLIGLERDDYTVLPDAVYAQGFLKTYANFLGLDGSGLSQELRSRRRPRRERGISYELPQSKFEQPIINPGGVSGTDRPRVSRAAVATLVAAVLVVAALIGALYFVGLNVQASAGGAPAPPGQEDAPSRGGDPDPSGQNAEPGEAGGRQPVSNGDPLDTLKVGVTVEDDPVWIQVRSDSETVFEEIAQPGFSRTFEARREVGIRAGYAGPVSVEVNGQTVEPLGEPGEVLDRSFTLKSAS